MNEWMIIIKFIVVLKFFFFFFFYRSFRGGFFIFFIFCGGVKFSLSGYNNHSTVQNIFIYLYIHSTQLNQPPVE